MQNPSAFERSLLALIVGSAILSNGAIASADDKQVCSAAYDQTQSLRGAGKLRAAREQAVSCMRDSCAAFIRTDCVKWLGEIDAAQPSVVFEAHDAQGKETRAVRVKLDGAPWLPELDGRAKPIDPGQHVLRYETDGAAAVTETVQIREGDKNRLLAASFAVNASVPVPANSTPEEPSSPDHASSPSITPWIIGGVGVAGLAVGAITGAMVLSDKSKTNSACSDQTSTCTSQDAVSAASQGKTLGPVSTIGFVVGGLGIGVATVWLVTRKSTSNKPAATLGMGPTGSATGAGWRLQGSF